ncbi:hypothetical protein [Nocardia amamiensis]|uniref:hypothetical protein n=1 Tax=Nocardia amamiensis TaxID=404578 RepID=UPI000AEECAA0|nr:hypothetical protein [Nocardia amamiensis]
MTTRNATGRGASSPEAPPVSGGPSPSAWQATVTRPADVGCVDETLRLIEKAGGRGSPPNESTLE